jgi:hypothetical protein
MNEIDEYVNKFLELLRYAKYINDGEVKIQCLLSGLRQSYKDRIEFDDPQTLDEAIRNANYCYE